MRKLFCVNARKYDERRNFDVFYPASLDKPRNNAVMFLNKKNIHKLLQLDMVKDCIIFYPTNIKLPATVECKNVAIPSSDPRTDYCLFFKDNKITNYPPREKCRKQDDALIAETASIGKQTVVMPYAYIGGEVRIGACCYVGVGSRIVGKVCIGDNVVIRENTVIGADGLSTDRDGNGRAVTMPQFGGVIIENDVQIGANCVIARGAIDDTTIKRGSKIDNSTFISHNVIVGEDTFIVGETIMFGGASTGKNVYISGNATIRNKVKIGDNASIGMGAVVVKNVENDSVVVSDSFAYKLNI